MLLFNIVKHKFDKDNNFYIIFMVYDKRKNIENGVAFRDGGLYCSAFWVRYKGVQLNRTPLQTFNFLMTVVTIVTVVTSLVLICWLMISVQLMSSLGKTPENACHLQTFDSFLQ